MIRIHQSLFSPHPGAAPSGRASQAQASSLGGTRFQSPPGLASDPAEACTRMGVPSARERARWDLGGKNLRNETQETYVYTVGRDREKGTGNGEQRRKMCK